MAGLSILSNQYPDINFILKSRYEDLNESYNRPNTIFLAHVRRMHWVCISNIYLSSNTRNIDKELYVVYDCFTKGSSSCSTHVDWLNGFSFFMVINFSSQVQIGIRDNSLKLCEKERKKKIYFFFSMRSNETNVSFFLA